MIFNFIISGVLLILSIFNFVIGYDIYKQRRLDNASEFNFINNGEVVGTVLKHSNGYYYEIKDKSGFKQNLTK